MSECEVHWQTDFPLIVYWAHQEIFMVISLKKQTNKYKEKLVILQSIGIIVIKSKETMMITYTCRCSSENLIPNFSLYLCLYICFFL